jgi:agmatine/peptidylarginine deiminase
VTKEIKEAEELGDSCILTEAEKVQVSVMIEKVMALQNQLRDTQVALSSLIESIVWARNLDPAFFGVNLAAGKILRAKKPGGNSREN